jgi:hypothetical protein
MFLPVTRAQKDVSGLFFADTVDEAFDYLLSRLTKVGMAWARMMLAGDACKTATRLRGCVDCRSGGVYCARSIVVSMGRYFMRTLLTRIRLLILFVGPA